MDGNPDDMQLIRQLDRTKIDDWKELRTVAEQMTDDDRALKWAGGERQPDGTYTFGYPNYSERISKTVSLLNTVGAVTPLYHWNQHGLPNFTPDIELTVADAIRAATYIVRGERFGDGVIARASKNDLLDAILKALIKWYDGE